MGGVLRSTMKDRLFLFRMKIQIFLNVTLTVIINLTFDIPVLFNMRKIILKSLQYRHTLQKTIVKPFRLYINVLLSSVR